MTQEEIIKHTKNLVAIRSTADNLPGLAAAVGYVAKLLVPYPGITVERFESEGVPSLLAYYGKTRPERFDTILNGHLDVVPAQNEGQYIAELKDGRLYGRGTYDMKMAVVIMTDLFIRYGRNMHRAIGLQIVADEETSGRNGIRHQLKQGVSTDFAILGEMTNLDICNETRGLCWIEIGFKGASAHGGYAWNGDNAVTKASDFALALLKKFPLPKEQQWCSTANIAAISTGNTTFNIVPDDATVMVDFRFTPEDPHFKSHDTLAALVASIDPKAEIRDITTFEPAVHVPATNTHLRHLVATYENVTGNSAQLIRRYGSSDSRHLAAHGIPGVEFGLSGAGLHTDNEYVDLASIEPFRNTLHAFLQSPIPSNPPSMQEKAAAVVSVA